MVNLKTYVPADAFTAGTLGTERAGSGVVIAKSGLVATIGYLITEAETIWITSADGRATPGHAMAYDQESGFGLVQALGQLDLPYLECGDSDRLKVSDQVVFAAAAAAITRWKPAWSGGRSLPAIGNTCWTTRSSPPRRTRSGAAAD